MSEAVTLPTGHATVALLAEAAAVASAMQSAVIIIIAIARIFSTATPPRLRRRLRRLHSLLQAAGCRKGRRRSEPRLRRPHIHRPTTHRSPATRAIMLTTSLFSAAQQHQQSTSLTCIEPLDSAKQALRFERLLWPLVCLLPRLRTRNVDCTAFRFDPRLSDALRSVQHAEECLSGQLVRIAARSRMSP